MTYLSRPEKGISMIRRQSLFFLFATLLVGLSLASPASAKAFNSPRLTVTVEGSGPDIILLPGHSSSPRVWREMIDAVPGYRYHKVQVNGFAGAPVGGNLDGDVAAPVAEEIARYIKQRKLKRVVIIGHSMGGTMGMMVAARHPKLVSKLMVVDMMPFMGAMFGGPDSTRDTLMPVATQIREGIVNSPSDAYAKQLEGTIAGMVATVSMRAGALDDAKKSDRSVAARAFSELVVTDLRPELPRITAKTVVLYVTPRGSPASDAQIDGYYRASYANLKNVTLDRVTDAAHFIMWDNARTFQAKVKAFLEG